MSHATPRERRREANLERILDAAMQMVVDKGFDGLSINGLARAVDYTPGALYRYFENGKDQLMIALVGRAIGEFHDEIRGRVTATEPIARIVEYLTLYRRVSIAASNRFGLVSMMMAHPRILVEDRAQAEPALAALTEALQPLAVSFAEAQVGGALSEGDPVQRALAAFSSIHGVLQLRKQARFSPNLIDMDRLANEVLGALLRGWGAADERLVELGVVP